MWEIFQVDWRIFMAGAEAWLRGRSPYGPLSSEFSSGAFAYPPTALPWLALFLPLGAFGFYAWTALELVGWFLLTRGRRADLLLLIWSPMILHLFEGQNTLGIVLVLWAATRARSRGFGWGAALSWALSKPQVALLPVAFLLWRDRNGAERWRLWAGIAAGTLVLALPATLAHPHIWGDWLRALSSYRGRLVQLAPWQGPSALLVVGVAYLWQRSHKGGWQWWLTAALFPQTSFYSTVALVPALRVGRSYWTLGGLGLAAALQGPMSARALPFILAGHLLAAWMIAGGPARGELKVAGESTSGDSRSPSSVP